MRPMASHKHWTAGRPRERETHTHIASLMDCGSEQFQRPRDGPEFKDEVKRGSKMKPFVHFCCHERQ